AYRETAGRNIESVPPRPSGPVLRGRPLRREGAMASIPPSTTARAAPATSISQSQPVAAGTAAPVRPRKPLQREGAQYFGNGSTAGNASNTPASNTHASNTHASNAHASNAHAAAFSAPALQPAPAPIPQSQPAVAGPSAPASRRNPLRREAVVYFNQPIRPSGSNGAAGPSAPQAATSAPPARPLQRENAFTEGVPEARADINDAITHFEDFRRVNHPQWTQEDERVRLERDVGPNASHSYIEASNVKIFADLEDTTVEVRDEEGEKQLADEMPMEIEPNEDAAPIVEGRRRIWQSANVYDRVVEEEMARRWADVRERRAAGEECEDPHTPRNDVLEAPYRELINRMNEVDRELIEAGRPPTDYRPDFGMDSLKSISAFFKDW
ncbi:hypothetical protein EVG20_g5972, partial [Dentipellis fragilis]